VRTTSRDGARRPGGMAGEPLRPTGRRTGMARRWIGVLALGLGMLAGACTATPPADEDAQPTPRTAQQSGTESPAFSADADPEPERPTAEEGREIVGNPWSLDAIDPGDRVLRVTTFYGGEASDCFRYAGISAVETAEAVTIRTWLSANPAATGCTAEGIAESEVIELAAPLGDRALRGCEHHDCRDPAKGDDGGGLYRDAVVAEGTAVVGGYDLLAVLDADDGSPRWVERIEPDISYGGVAVAEGVVLAVGQGDEKIVAFGAEDGEQRWSQPYAAWYARDPVHHDGALAALDRQGHVTLIDLQTGEPRWTRAPPEGRTTHLTLSDGLVVTATTIDMEDPPTGTHVVMAATTAISVLDAADGSVRWEARLPGGPYGLHLVDDVVIARVFGALYGFDVADGTERWRRLPYAPDTAPSWRVEDGVLSLPWDLAAEVVDPQTGEGRPWEAEGGHAGAEVVGELVVRTTPDGTVQASEVGSGATRWTADLRAVAGRPGGDDELVLVPTALGAVALDARDGTVRWSWVDPAPERVRPEIR
jgi:outer membrane protein assembly factor BamB